MKDRNDYRLDFLRAMQNIIGIVDTLEFQIENNNADDNVVITYESCEVVETKIDEPKNQKKLLL